MARSQHDDRRRQAAAFCERYVGFWAMVCLVGFCYFGWPTLVAWLGLVWGMRMFLMAFFGERSAKSPDGRCRRMPRR